MNHTIKKNIKSKFKVFFQFASVFLVSSLLALPFVKAADETYTCLYQRPNLMPNQSDPYKLRLTTITDTLLKTIGDEAPRNYKNEKVVEFYKNSLTNDSSKGEMDDPRTQIGDFRMGGYLGNGDEGTVNLAQHMPSQIFCAVKILTCDPNLSFEGAVKKSAEVYAYKTIDRLFGLYRFQSWQHYNCASYYMFIPLVDGNLVNYFSYTKSFQFFNYKLNENELIYHNLQQNLELLQSVLKEHQYLFDHRVAQVEVNSPNTMFSNDGKHLVFVDLGGTLQSVKNEETYDVSVYSLFYLRALGIYDYLAKKTFDLTVKVPEPIRQFHEKIRPKEGDDLCFRKHPLYFSALKTYVAKFEQDVESVSKS